MLRYTNSSLMITWLFVIVVTQVGAVAANRPNIVLMMSDDQGWGETSYNGHPYLKTPVLDEMAASGLRLDRFYLLPLAILITSSREHGRHPFGASQRLDETPFCPSRI